jgi:hypothetical protein
MIHDMIVSKSLTVAEMAHEAECSEREMIIIGKYLRVFAEAEEEDKNVVHRCPPIFIINILPSLNSALTNAVATTSPNQFWSPGRELQEEILENFYFNDLTTVVHSRNLNEKKHPVHVNVAAPEPRQ